MEVFKHYLVVLYFWSVEFSLLPDPLEFRLDWARLVDENAPVQDSAIYYTVKAKTLSYNDPLSNRHVLKLKTKISTGLGQSQLDQIEEKRTCLQQQINPSMLVQIRFFTEYTKAVIILQQLISYECIKNENKRMNLSQLNSELWTSLTTQNVYEPGVDSNVMLLWSTQES